MRDAVFGNVGTMICFRVSADDSPILGLSSSNRSSKPNDLLQMHNRNFVINMVISGEKTPAFSARTLNLPPPQIDNTGRIIENTRRLYSRSRAEVEQEISALIQPPKQLQAKKPPQSAAQQKQWPINAQTQTITPAPPPSMATAAPNTPAPMQQPAPVQFSPSQQGSGQSQPDENAPPKRKRTRSRKRKSARPSDDGSVSLPPVQSPAQSSHTTGQGDEHELRLR